VRYTSWRLLQSPHSDFYKVFYSCCEGYRLSGDDLVRVPERDAFVNLSVKDMIVLSPSDVKGRARTKSNVRV